MRAADQIDLESGAWLIAKSTNRRHKKLEGAYYTFAGWVGGKNVSNPFKENVW